MSDHHRGCCDTDCDSGLRNRYFEGKRLTAEAFRIEQRYLLERRWMLNRAIHGWGVVHGYAVKADKKQEGALMIGRGLALDACGRELVRVRGGAVELDDVILLDAKGRRVSKDASFEAHVRENEQTGKDPNSPNDPRQDRGRACWLLRVHYAERPMDPMDLKDPCNCDRTEWNQVCETVRFSLQRIDCDDCCDPNPCELHCECATGPCCEPRAGHDRVAQRGGCRCLCDHLTKLPVDAECDCLTDLDDPCGRVRVDLRNGVKLACVAVRRDDCNGWAFDTDIDPCGPRRLVKRNDLLYDLIRGCDLTRISAIGWKDWHRNEKRMPLDVFQKSFGSADPADDSRNVTDLYWVEFSREVRAATVRADCFTMTVTVAEDEAGWGESRRVPILGVLETLEPKPEFITRATLLVDSGWVHDATLSRKKIFNQDEALVEIQIHGDYIIDCNGQAVDANAAGLVPAPSGNGTPGGTFLSNFRVAPRDAQGGTS
jgi:hypothetical protein